MKSYEFYLTDFAYRSAAERQLALARNSTGIQSFKHALKAASYLQRCSAGPENNLQEVDLNSLELTIQMTNVRSDCTLMFLS